MKKRILTLITALMISVSFQANALISDITMLMSGGTTIALVALSGTALGTIVAGHKRGDVNWKIVGLMVLGIVVLDGESEQEINFSSIDQDKLLSMGLTEAEAAAYNENTEELSVAFKIVSSQLTENSSVKDAEDLWNIQAEIIGSDAVDALKKIVQTKN